jgi:hypothetical protein
MSYTKRLIDAEAFRNNLEVDRFGYTDIVKVNIALDKSTVDAVEVVHARWDDSFDGITPYCTACGRSHNCINRTPNYCPNCGAKMDGGNEDA